MTSEALRAATVVQALQDLFYVILHVLFYLWSLLYPLFGNSVKASLLWIAESVNRVEVDEDDEIS